MRWTPEHAKSVAPAVAQEGLRWASPGVWSVCGAQAELVWGELIQGRYQVVLDAKNGRWACNCPRPERPCAHVVGLGLLEPEPPPGAPPPWVVRWQKRTERVRKAATHSEASDLQARDKRAKAREARVSLGISLLLQRLEDLARRGLASQPDEAYLFWDELAAKMVDHQAPGLAQRLRLMGGLAHTGPGWEQRMLDALGRLVVLLLAWQNRSGLAPPLLAELRARIGYSIEKNELRQSSGEQDRWWVLGRRIEVEDQLRVQRTWLLGERGHAALVLVFAVGNRPLDQSLVPGQAVEAELVRYPGTCNDRVEPKTLIATENVLSPLGGHARSISESVATFADRLAQSPWLERQLFWLGPVVPARVEGTFGVGDQSGDWLPIAAQYPAAWQLLAESGGHPLVVGGEWDGERLWPLATWSAGRLSVLEGGG